MILFKKQLFDLEVKGQGPTNVIAVRDTPLYGHAPTYQISLTYLERQPEALKSLYRSPGNKKNQLVLCKNYVLRHLGITINIKNTKFVKDLPMIDAQFRFNQCNSFREEYISVFSPYGSVLIL